MNTSTNSLSGLTDKELIRRIKSDADSEAFLEICRRYENIFYRICHKYDKRVQAAGLNCDDIFEEKNTIIFHCINTFDFNRKTKLSTWIGNYARYLCLNSIKSRQHIFPSDDVEIQKAIENSQSDSTIMETDSIKNDKDYFMNILDRIGDKRIADIIRLRYFSDKKLIWKKIAKKLNLSVQTCINLNARGLKILKNKIGSKQMMDII